MKYKILILTLMMCIMTTTVFAINTHYFVVDDKGPASDVVKMNALTSFIAGKGEKSVTVLNSEIHETPANVITVFIYYGEVVITTPNKYISLAEDISDFLLNTYNINAEIKVPDEIDAEDFTYEIKENNLPEEAKGLLYRIKRMSSNTKDANDFLTIYGTGDKDAFPNIIAKHFSQANSVQNRVKGNESKSSDILGKNILIVGGPCAVPEWTAYSNETCKNWPYKEREGIIKIVSVGDYRVLLVAGTTAEDTQLISEMIHSGQIQYGEGGNTWAKIEIK